VYCMGQTVTKAASSVGNVFGMFGTQTAKILMIGLDDAGKTSTLYVLAIVYIIDY
jgi:GTPase SAR1 family protein